MATYVNANNAYSTLAGNMTNVATTFTVAAGNGARFPTVAGSDWTYVTLQNSANTIEILKITAHALASDSFTCSRAQEGTTAVAWSTGDVVECRLTAATAVTVDGTQTLTNKTIAAYTLSGTVSGGGNQINNIIVGTSTPLAGAFTTLAATAITGTGLLDLSGAAAGQVSFPATQNPSAGANVLDDYEEGTWTPTIAGGATYTTQNGTYTKVGRKVLAQCTLTINAINAGSPNSIAGLPFASANPAIGSCDFSGSATNIVFLIASVTSPSSTAILRSLTVAAAVTVGAGNPILQNGASVSFSLGYQV